MPRFAFLLEYDGGPYSGWQRQSHAPSVQATFEAALARRTQNSGLKVAAAG